MNSVSDSKYNMRQATEEELESLVKKTAKYLPESYTVFSFLSIGFQRNIVDKSLTKIYVPTSEEIPLFVIIRNVIRKDRNSMSPFWDTKEVSNEVAKRLLSALPNWDWEEPFLVRAAPMDNLRQIEEIVLGENGLGNNKMKMVECGEGYTYKVPSDANMKIKVPDNFIVAPLEESFAHVVYKNWKYKFGDSLEGVLCCMRSLPAMAAFTKVETRNAICERNESHFKPVSWVVCRPNGELGCTFTYPEYRNKGLAKVVTCALADKILQMGIPPIATISDENVAAIKSHKNAGFRKYCTCGYHLYLKKNMEKENF